MKKKTKQKKKGIKKKSKSELVYLQERLTPDGRSNKKKKKTNCQT